LDQERLPYITKEVQQIKDILESADKSTLESHLDYLEKREQTLEWQSSFVDSRDVQHSFGISFFDDIKHTIEATMYVFEGDTPCSGIELHQEATKLMPKPVWRNEILRLVFKAQSEKDLLDCAAALFDAIEHANGDTITRSRWPTQACLFNFNPKFAETTRKKKGWLTKQGGAHGGVKNWKVSFRMIRAPFCSFPYALRLPSLLIYAPTQSLPSDAGL
jgi:hypothetical protein